MAPLPKRKHSTRRKGKRRAALFVSLSQVSPCPKCGKGRMPHRMCHNCGYYNDRVVIAPKKSPAVPADSKALKDKTASTS